MHYDASRDALFRPSTRPVFLGARGLAAPGAAGPSAFAASDAWWMIGAAHLAYYPEIRLEDALAPIGWRLIAACEREAARALILGTADGSDVILAFRGTHRDQMRHLSDNADVRLVEMDGLGRVHRGFLATLDRVWPAIETDFGAASAGAARVWYTGHSLGGALAVLAAGRRAPDAVYTFGTPRIGDRQFQRSLAELPIWRLFNCADVVATVPPKSLGFRHVGVPWFIDACGRLHARPSRRMVVTARALGGIAYARRLAWMRPRLVPARSLADHAVVNYAFPLREACRALS